VELQIGVEFLSEADIMLSGPAGVEIGVSDLIITGELSVMLRPLMSKSPFIGGLEVFFVNPPHVDMSFRGMGTIANMPSVHNSIRSLIEDVITRALVAPNRIAKAITEENEVDLARLRFPDPLGVLRITVVKAVNLEGRDFAVFGKKTSDPYVRIKLETHTWRTPSVDSTCDPIWTEGNVFHTFIYNRAQHLRFDVFDQDVGLKSDDTLGSLDRTTKAKDFIKHAGEAPVAFPLGPASDDGRIPPKGAQLFLQFKWLNFVQEPHGHEGAQSSHGHVIALKIDEVCDVPSGLDAPFTVRLRLEGSKESTDSGKGWAKGFAVASTESLVRVRKLWRLCGLDSKTIADVMMLDQELVEEIIATAANQSPDSRGRSPSRRSDHVDKDLQFLAKMQDSRNLVEQSCNPQFEEVLRLMLHDLNSTAVVELVNSNKKSPEVVARFEIDVANELAGGPLDGPFDFAMVTKGGSFCAHSKTDTSTMQLQGTLAVYKLEPGELPPRDSGFRD
jgi:hypothetical protein